MYVMYVRMWCTADPLPATVDVLPTVLTVEATGSLSQPYQANVTLPLSVFHSDLRLQLVRSVLAAW